MLYLAGPGHGGPALVAAGYLEGTYTEIYPQVTQDEDGMLRLFRQFSAPGGIPSHVSVTTPGSIHEGGELGYVLVHAFGAVMDNPDLIALAVVGDGEAETGPLEGSWKGISFLNPARDGAVLPILHLNGAKIAGPTVLARKDPAEVRSLLRGPRLRGASRSRATTCPACTTGSPRRWPRPGPTIRAIQAAARGGDWDGAPAALADDRAAHARRAGPARTWSTASRCAGTWRSHQVPLSGVKDNPEHLRDPRGRGCAPTGPRSSSTPTARPTELVAPREPRAATCG